MKEALAEIIQQQVRASVAECLKAGDKRWALQFLHGELWQLDAICRMLGLPELKEMVEE